MGRVDELGSGILNVTKYLPHYSTNNKPPQFIEGDIFKTVIPIDHDIDNKGEGVNEGVNEGVTEGVNELFFIIKENPGKRVPFLAEKINSPGKTIERWLKILKEEGKIKFTGNSKTGGYFVVLDKRNLKP